MFLHSLQILLVKLVRMTPHHVPPPGTGHTEGAVTVETLVRFQLQVDSVYVTPHLGGPVSTVEYLPTVLANWNKVKLRFLTFLIVMRGFVSLFLEVRFLHFIIVFVPEIC